MPGQIWHRQANLLSPVEASGLNFARCWKLTEVNRRPFYETFRASGSLAWSKKGEAHLRDLVCEAAVWGYIKVRSHKKLCAAGMLSVSEPL